MQGGMPWFRDRLMRNKILGTALFVFIGLFLVGAKVNAADGVIETLKNFGLNFFGFILGVLITFLGKLIILLVNVLISFAKYNNFVHAQPVEIGWVLMRDVANMFFIVILLVSAFSTIIGYPKEFHYTSVLPKLLLYAVLINFSKTLIGLLIDFSQVVMLTFVNAFAQAAGGNFINALKLTKVTTLASDGAEDQYKVDSSLLPASILGVFMLGITLTLLCIMIAFVIFRVIGLWLLLIVSPMAFFALALPPKLAKALTAFTSKFWDRLSALLIGGPVMAFFLWLALAVVQGSGGDRAFAELYTEKDEATNALNFATKVGNAGDIATFIVAVALMLSGVEFAVQVSKDASPSLGSLAKMTASGGGAAVHLARGLARVSGKGFNAIDRRTDFRGKIGRKGMELSGKFGGVGAGTFSAMAGHRGKEINEEQKKLSTITQGLDPKSRSAYLRARTQSINPREASAAKLALAEDALSSSGMRIKTAGFKTQLEAEEEKKPKNERMSGAQLQARAESMANKQAAQDIKAAKATAQELGDDVKLDKYKEAIKKNPSLGSDWSDYAGIKNGSVTKPDQYLQDVNAESIKDSRAFFAHASALGLIDQNGEKIEGGNWELMNQGKDRRRIAEEHMNSTTPAERKAQLEAIDGKSSKLADDSHRFASKDATGSVGSVLVNRAGAQVQVTQNFKNQPEINKYKEAAHQADLGNKDSEASAARAEMMKHGADMGEAFGFDASKGAFGNSRMAEGFGEQAGKASAGAGMGDEEALKALTAMITDALEARSGGENEARTAAAAAVDPEDLKKALDQAMNKGDDKAKQKLVKLASLIEDESSRIDRLAAKVGVSRPEIAGIAKNPESEASKQAMLKLQSAGVPNPKASAKAAVHGWDIAGDTQLRMMSQKVIAEVQKAVNDAKGQSYKDRRSKRSKKA